MDNYSSSATYRVDKQDKILDVDKIDYRYEYGIYTEDSLTVELKNNNSINIYTGAFGYENNQFVYGIYMGKSDGVLTFKGTGTLDVKVDSNYVQNNAYGIHSSGRLVFDEGKINVYGQTAGINSSLINSEAETLVINQGNVTAKGADAGVRLHSGGGYIVINGGALRAEGMQSVDYHQAIEGGNAIKLTNGMQGRQSSDGINWEPLHYYYSSDKYMLDKGLNYALIKGTQNAPDVPAMDSNTLFSITLSAVEGCEYSMDNTNWQDSTTFDELLPGTEYTFYQRLKETDTHFISNSSSAKISTQPHTHEWSYEAGTGVSKNTITAICADSDKGHGTPKTDTLTLVAPTDCVYDGQTAFPISFKDNKASVGDITTLPDIQYQMKIGDIWQEAVTTAPMQPGTYMASLTLSNVKINANESADVTASVEYTVSPAKITNIEVRHNDTLIYNGTPQKVEFNNSATTVGNQPVTYSYSKTMDGTFVEELYVTNVSEGGKYFCKVTAPYHEDEYVETHVNFNRGQLEKPATPVLKKATARVIELVAIDGAEYRLSTSNTYQDSPIFTGLDSYTEYTFLLRLKEDENNHASPESEPSSFSTIGHAHEWSYRAEGPVIYATCANTDGGS